jgi:hypothetical protein
VNAAAKVTVYFLGFPAKDVSATDPAFVASPPPDPPVELIDAVVLVTVAVKFVPNSK